MRKKREKLGRVAGPEALQCLWRSQCGDGDDELQVLRLEAVDLATVFVKVCWGLGNSHRIHGAGIYANMTGVYGW